MIDRGVVQRLTEMVVAHGGNWEESRLARLGGDFAGVARISAEAGQVAELTSALLGMSDADLDVHVRPAESTLTSGQEHVVHLTCSGADHEGIVNRVSSHLAELGANVEEMRTAIEPAPTTGTPLFSMSCAVRLPSACNLESLAGDLELLADQLGVEISLSHDAVPSGGQ